MPRLGETDYAVTVLLLFVAGIVFWEVWWALEATNKESFCISCHEMENVFKEYQNTVPTNRTGVRATCPDCHVPKRKGPRLIRKIRLPTGFARF